MAVIQRKGIPPAELDVLACVRNHGPITASGVREQLSKYRPMTHGAVATLLKRLEVRGVLTKKKGPVGKAFLFESIKKSDESVKHWLGSTLKRVFQGDQAAFVASLFQTRPPTVAEVDQLQAMLDEIRRKQKKEKL